MGLHVALLCEELLTTDIGGMDLKEQLLSSAAPLLPSPVELVVSSSGGTSQLNLGNSTRDILSRCSSSPSLFCVQPHTRGTAHICPGLWSRRMLRLVPASAAILSQLTGMWKELCCSEPMQSSELYKEPQHNSSSLAFDLAGSDGGRGRGCPFFCFLNWGLPVCHFLLCILSLQSGSIMIAYYVNIKDNCRALIKANSVSFPPSLPHSSRLSQEHNKLNQLPQIMHALAREIQQGQASQGQRNILSSSTSLCFLQPSFVVCHGKNSNESLRAVGEIPVRHKPIALFLLFIFQIQIFCYPALSWRRKVASGQTGLALIADSM